MRFKHTTMKTLLFFILIPSISFGQLVNITGAYQRLTYASHSSTFDFKVPISLNVNTTDVGNIGAGEDNLMTYALPGGTLAVNNERVEFEMVFACAANGASKTIKIYFGSSSYTFPAFTTSGTFVRAVGNVVRTGATAQRFSLLVTSDNGTTQVTGTTYLTPGETLSGNITIKATGTATNDNDIVQKILTVKFFPI